MWLTINRRQLDYEYWLTRKHKNEVRQWKEKEEIQVKEILSCERFNITAITDNNKKNVMNINKNEEKGTQKQKLQV